MNTPFKYRAFISYSHSDEKWARWLHHNLETYRIPKHLVGTETEFGPIPERFAPVFRDREELASATNLGTTLIAALEQSACQIVICSPKAAKSRWVNEEILTFKRLGREHRIFCLIVAGEPGASGNPETAAHECFPNALIYKLGADGQLSYGAQRADCGRRAAGQGSQGKRAAQAACRHAGHRLRRAQAAGSPPPLSPHGGAGVGIRRGHGDRVGARGDGLDRAQRGRCARRRWRSRRPRRRGRSRSSSSDLFKVCGPERGLVAPLTAQEILDKGAARIEKGTRGPAGHPGDADGHDGHGVYGPRPLPQAIPLMRQSLAKAQVAAGRHDRRASRRASATWARR